MDLYSKDKRWMDILELCWTHTLYILYSIMYITYERFIYRPSLDAFAHLFEEEKMWKNEKNKMKREVKKKC